MNELISVVLPAYNAESSIEAAIKSVLDQSYNKIELIVINDGSSDGTREIAESFAGCDPRVVVINQDNKGLVSALNTGVSRATGKYVARMDADDVSLPDRLAVQKRFLDANGDVEIVGGQASKIASDGRVLGFYEKPRTRFLAKLYSFFACPLIHPTYLMRKDAFNLVGGYRDVDYAEDYDFLIRARQTGLTFVNVGETVLNYSVSSTGISRMHEAEQIVVTNDLSLRVPKFLKSGKVRRIRIFVCNVGLTGFSLNKRLVSNLLVLGCLIGSVDLVLRFARRLAAKTIIELDRRVYG